MAWITFQGNPWKAPKRKSKTLFDLRAQAVRDIRCPKCEAEPGEGCLMPYASGFVVSGIPHDERVALAMLRHGMPEEQ